MLNIFGGYGFVGTQFCNTTKNGYIKNYRDNYQVRKPDCVYFISTVDNYNVHISSTVDIDTNLIVLMRVLDEYRKYIKETGQRSRIHANYRIAHQMIGNTRQFHDDNT